MAEDYHVSDIYQGGYSSLDSESYGSVFTGYHGNIAQLGLSTDPRTANILKEFSDKLAPGQKVIELSLITPEVLEAVPKQHLKEIQRLSKLTGVEPTVHGPLLDASGVTQQGFSEQQRKVTERKLLYAIERSHELNPDGNIPVTFHTANQLPGARWNRISEKEQKERGLEKPEEIEFMPVVNQETGQITAVKKETRYYPRSITEEISKGKYKDYLIGEEKKYSAEKQLEIMNHTEWDKNLFEVETNREHAERILQNINPAHIGRYIQVKQLERGDKKIPLTELEDENIKKIYSAEEFIQQAEMVMHSAFSKAYKYGTEIEKKYLKDLAKQYSNILGYKEDGKLIEGKERYQLDPKIQSQALFTIMKGMERVSPKIYKPAEDFALEKSKETFGNVAWETYKKFKDKSPIINIENPPAGFGLSRAENVKDMVEGARAEFEKIAVEKGGMSKSEAKKQAEKMIGVTWDVGHINQLRQFGFTSEDIIKEAEKIKPLLKHIHLSDNFGMENVELPMGMGNVDFKEIMKKLGDRGEKVRKIVEAAHWWQFQQTSPMAVTLEALGSPIYGMKMAPYWNQAQGFHQGYFGGYGAFLPQINYETFGAGFSNLPTELGGQKQQTGRSRMGGTPME